MSFLSTCRHLVLQWEFFQCFLHPNHHSDLMYLVPDRLSEIERNLVDMKLVWYDISTDRAKQFSETLFHLAKITSYLIQENDMLITSFAAENTFFVVQYVWNVFRLIFQDWKCLPQRSDNWVWIFECKQFLILFWSHLLEIPIEKKKKTRKRMFLFFPHILQLHKNKSVFPPSFTFAILHQMFSFLYALSTNVNQSLFKNL